ncbi:MAG: ATP-dependent Clp protease proteolytic subunit [Clostridia bacterium]|nr:ATP-dependent Clp protease proteolytic subunit [Clostridia bacterium]
MEEPIRDMGSVVTGGRDSLHCLAIVGQIEGHQVLSSQTKTTKYEHILPLLASIEESPDIDGLLILLNTAGGDVEAGLAIAELIAGMEKPTVSLVLGGGHSIGVPLAVAAKKCFIAPTASMTLHPVRMNGTVLGVPQILSYFQRIQESIVDFITANSRIDPDTLRTLMQRNGQLMGEAGSVVYGPEAVELGLCDALGGLSDALACLHQMIAQKRCSGGEDRA